MTKELDGVLGTSNFTSFMDPPVNKTALDALEEEEMKRTQFIAFVSLHEILLQKRTVQHSLNKKEEKQ